MKVIYVGPGDGVTLAPAWGGIEFPAGQPVEVPDELAAQLLAQDTFRVHQAKGSAAKAKPDVETR